MRSDTRPPSGSSTDSTASVMCPRPSAALAGAASVIAPVKRTPEGTASTPSIRTGLVDSAVKASPGARRLGAERRLEREAQPRARRHRHAQPRLAAHHAAHDPGRLLRHQAPAFARQPRAAAQPDPPRRAGTRSAASASPSAASLPAPGRAAEPAPHGTRPRRSAAVGLAAGKGSAARAPAVGAETTVVWPHVAQRLDERGARGVARGRVLGDRALQHRAHSGRQPRRGEVHRRRLLGQDLDQDHATRSRPRRASAR